MIVLFTPFSFIFFFLYSIFLLSLLYCADFYSYWVIMECSSLIFIGLSYRYLSYGFSSIMLYFIVQALSSVSIFVFYCFCIDPFVIVFLFLKLAVFPFSGWFLPVVYKMDSFLFFLICTFQKFPSVLMFYLFLSALRGPLVIIFLLFTVFYCSLFMFNTTNLRVFMSFSSVGGNPWFIISCSCGFDTFLFFFIVYTLNFFFVVFLLGSSNKFPPCTNFVDRLYFSVLILSIGGFPPFPPFFFKAYIVYFVCYYSLFSFSIFILFLVSAVYILSCYFRLCFYYFVNNCSSQVLFLYYSQLVLLDFTFRWVYSSLRPV